MRRSAGGVWRQITSKADLATSRGRRFAERHARAAISDPLINNAGVMALPRRQLRLMVSRCSSAPTSRIFRLTARLLPLPAPGQRAAVVSVSSLAHRTGSIDFGDLQGERHYSPWKGIWSIQARLPDVPLNCSGAATRRAGR